MTALFAPGEFPLRNAPPAKKTSHDPEGNLTREAQALIDWWAGIQERCPRLSRVTGMTQKSLRTKLVRARLNDREFLEALPTLAEKICKSTFLRGEAAPSWNGRKWKVQFDWLLTGDNWRKVAEGRYDDDRDGDANVAPSTGTPEAGAADDEFLKRWKDDAASGSLVE